MSFFYYFANAVMRFLLLTLSRWKVIGRENVPRRGPLIVVANHLNLADPPLLGASIPRRIYFMAKEELFSSRFVRAYGAFPVCRGAPDRKAILTALRLLEEGKAVGMFPEGRRSPTRKLQKAHPGTALIAFRSRAPILPVAITGTEKITGPKAVIFGHPEITVRVGEPFYLPSYEGRPTTARLAELSDYIMLRIAALLPPEYRGIYGDKANK